MNDSSSNIDILLQLFVKRNSEVYCSQWDPNIRERLVFDPFNPNRDNGFISHYFLPLAQLSAIVYIADNIFTCFTSPI